MRWPTTAFSPKRSSCWSNNDQPSAAEQGSFRNTGSANCHDLWAVVRSQTETCVRDGIVYRVERTWDDETGASEIREFDLDGNLVRRCDWRIWPDEAQRDDQIGEAVWFDTLGAEIARHPLRERA